MPDTRTPYEKMASAMAEHERAEPMTDETVVILDHNGNQIADESGALEGGRVLRGDDADAWLRDNKGKSAIKASSPDDNEPDAAPGDRARATVRATRASGGAESAAGSAPDEAGGAKGHKADSHDKRAPGEPENKSGGTV